MFRLKFKRSSPDRGAPGRALPMQSHGVESQKEEHTDVLLELPCGWRRRWSLGKGGEDSLVGSHQGGFMQGIVGCFE